MLFLRLLDTKTPEGNLSSPQGGPHLLGFAQRQQQQLQGQQLPKYINSCVNS